ncbi:MULTISPECIES: GGDEF domain-containing protein [Shewanella]|jgi:diguanylate cyclase (GGDEF)-like protein|uniref:diguanylate cyclase n=1 Tax=Shewanella chilikensis TaxID=558541 RepID=A0ABX5PKQ5_9GAMM|nr:MULTISPECIES: sensor domain-containing diguanylate cyclase [Shewanella]MCA0948702.1 sensor domain-containing diguanylate cyclase [Shewanella chilikensis]MCE9850912.1 sensor domain-containing diguanylate cyclase [Shewanella chilikensis]MCL1155266.1 sensor domain-containing diguanylate cyclase [Shewanella chilikensis]MCL1161409.1 sensor domain-containing diguanylate cyclase [Shewanella chilikensis]PYE56943.1 diguanylate cyclase [Shewanella chilikensis]
MAKDLNAINELHWLIDMVQTIEVGLVVLDREYNIQLWNGFMENHSGVSPNDIKGNNLFERFPDLPASWLKQKMESVFLLKNRAFISWEQRPYVFKFKNYRPITGRAEFMFQNVTLLPLASLTGQISHISIIIYDVTDIAINKLQLKSANERLEHLSQTDGLTQLHNRRHWQFCMQREFDRHTRYGEPASLVMFDIDHFKRINDSLGHIAGDRVIQHLSHILSQNLRETDCAGRYGGEEFAVVLSHTSAEDARSFAERLRTQIESSRFSFNGQPVPFTISLGICDLSDEVENSDQWLANADQALYQAKVSGRNCVSIFSD